MSREKTLLHIGCGPKRLKHLPSYFQSGWTEVRLDIDPSVNPDITASITDLSGVEKGAYDAVWSSHNIEHLFHHEAIEMVKQVRQLLTPDGWFVVTCPDIKSAMRHALKHGLDDPLYHSAKGPITPRDVLFGHLASIEAGNEFMAHRNGFDLKSLASVFDQSGFRKFYGHRRATNLWFIAGSFPSTEAAKAQLLAATKH
ncbi:class I SAM-dependent methyltransferase [Pseudooceanicola sp. MF1-13]|uniref:class I SAM-dependent methyltransferase n=1 Tax=Pseudooceanicola sp. MF1-13 TaxID=3379095 RepID=UPI003891EF8B